MRPVALALVLAALGGCATGWETAPTREQVVQRILPSAVQVVVEEDGRRVRSGSGVVIAAEPAGPDAECLVLTSGHALAGLTARQSVVVLVERHRGKGTRAPAALVARRDAGGTDLALLRIRSGRCAAARLGEPPALGDAVWVVAFPWGRGLTLTSGHVSQVDPDGDGAGRHFAVDASVSRGASGGGVFEAGTGRLVGVVEGYRTARVPFKGEPARYLEVPVSGETYAASLADIRRFLGEAGYGTLLTAR